MTKNKKSPAKSKSTEIDINHIAKLANLNLTQEEKDLFSKQLSDILDYVKQLEKANTEDTQPTFNVSSNKNIVRKDQTAESLTQDNAISNAKAKKEGYFVTKGVFENE